MPEQTVTTPLSKEEQDGIVALAAGRPECLPYAARTDAARTAIRHTMIAMDRRSDNFLQALLREAESQRPHVINSEAIRKLAREHGLM